MTQMTFFRDVEVPPSIPEIDIRCCTIERLLPEVRGARLILADPPWEYANTGTVKPIGSDSRGFRGGAKGQYETSCAEWVSSVLKASYASAIDDAYLLLWCTWPIMADWLSGRAPISLGEWHLLTGGAWGKIGGLGVGFHVRGDSEPWLLARKGSPKPTRRDWSNLHLEPRQGHSAKPVSFTRGAISALTEPGDLVLSLFVGTGNDAIAARLEGRAFVGAELDPERWRTACERVGITDGENK